MGSKTRCDLCLSETKAKTAAREWHGDDFALHVQLLQRSCSQPCLSRRGKPGLSFGRVTATALTPNRRAPAWLGSKRNEREVSTPPAKPANRPPLRIDHHCDAGCSDRSDMEITRSLCKRSDRRTDPRARLRSSNEDAARTKGPRFGFKACVPFLRRAFQASTACEWLESCRSCPPGG
jgi:hypothetical protein